MYTTKFDLIHASAAESGTSQTGSYLVEASNLVEFHVNISAISAGDITFSYQTSVDGTTWATIATELAKTTTQAFVKAFMRGDYALGKYMRLAWAKSGGGSATFSAYIGIKE